MSTTTNEKGETDLQNSASPEKDQLILSPSDITFLCRICSKTFTRKRYRNRHEKIHFKGISSNCLVTEAIPCTICNKIFADEVSLKLHSAVHEKLLCEVCFKCFSTSAELNEHYQKHFVERPYVCIVCSKTFRLERSLKAHSYNHLDNKRFGCNTCGRKFRLASTLLTHKYTHTKEKRYACGVCDRRFALLSTAKSHLSIHTKDQYSYACDICGKKFFRPHLLRRHRQTHYKGDSLVIKPSTKSCNLCDRKLNPCETCKKERPYSCEVCQLRFKERFNLRAHQRKVHSDEKLYQCDICFQTFECLQNIKEHALLHLNDYVESCDEDESSTNISTT